MDRFPRRRTPGRASASDPARPARPARSHEGPAPVLVGAVAALVLGLTVAFAASLTGPARWRDGERHGDWLAVFDGYGRTTASQQDGALTVRLEPKAAAAPDVTHAGLVVTQADYSDLSLSVQVRTDEQLRVGPPNPWEVAWVLWRYSDPDHFYALALKPNGWELSKQDPAYPGKQRFLATGSAPRFPVGEWHDLRVVHRGNVIRAYAGGRLLTTFTDSERPYLRGAVGLYCEDARVEFRDVAASPLPAVAAWRLDFQHEEREL